MRWSITVRASGFDLWHECAVLRGIKLRAGSETVVRICLFEPGIGCCLQCIGIVKPVAHCMLPRALARWRCYRSPAGRACSHRRRTPHQQRRSFTALATSAPQFVALASCLSVRAGQRCHRSMWRGAHARTGDAPRISSGAASPHYATSAPQFVALASCVACYAVRLTWQRCHRSMGQGAHALHRRRAPAPYQQRRSSLHLHLA